MTDAKLHIAMIIQAYLPRVGGAERQLAALLPLLQQRGIESFVLTRRFADLPSFEIINGTPVYRLPIPGPKSIAAFSFAVAAQAYIAHFRPNVIHAHELLSPATTALIAKQIFGVPVVAKVLRGGELGDLAKLKNRKFGWNRIAALRRGIDSFVVISQEIDQELADIGILSERRSFIPNGVDFERFSPLLPTQKNILRQSLGLPDGLIVVFAGRLDAEKRINHLLDIWPLILDEYSNAVLLILGIGAEEARLKKSAGTNVIFKGSIPDISPYLQSADIFVLPSATEGLSNALLEALAVGLPCVATAVGGTPDVIIDGSNGLLVPPDDLRSLHTALRMLLADSPQRQRLGQKARETIRARYSLENTANQLNMLYRRLSKGTEI